MAREILGVELRNGVFCPPLPGLRSTPATQARHVAAAESAKQRPEDLHYRLRPATGTRPDLCQYCRHFEAPEGCAKVKDAGHRGYRCDLYKRRGGVKGGREMTSMSPPKDWETVEDLDVDVRAQLPPEAQAIFLEAYKAVAGVSGIDHWQAMDAGYNAVKEAGWHQPTDRWVKVAGGGSMTNKSRDGGPDTRLATTEPVMFKEDAELRQMRATRDGWVERADRAILDGLKAFGERKGIEPFAPETIARAMAEDAELREVYAIRDVLRSGQAASWEEALQILEQRR